MNPAIRKKILFIHNAYNLSRAQEMLDIILMASSFNQEVSLMFLNEAVFLLNKGQNLTAIAMKNFVAAYQALSLYDINKIYLDEAALQQYDLKPENLLIKGVQLKQSALSEIIHQQDLIMNF